MARVQPKIKTTKNLKKSWARFNKSGQYLCTTYMTIYDAKLYSNKKVYLKCNAQICTDISLVFFSIAIGRWLKLSFCLLWNNLDKTIVRMCTSVAPFTVTNVRTNCKSAYCKKTHFFGKGILEQNSIGYKENATLQQKHSATYLLHKAETFI